MVNKGKGLFKWAYNFFSRFSKTGNLSGEPQWGPELHGCESYLVYLNIHKFVIDLVKSRSI